MPVPGITRLRELLGPPIARLERSVTRFVVREMPTFCYLARQLGAWWEARRRRLPARDQRHPAGGPTPPTLQADGPAPTSSIWRTSGASPRRPGPPLTGPGPGRTRAKPPPQGPPTC